MFKFKNKKNKKEKNLKKIDIDVYNICVYSSDYVYRKCVNLFPSIYGEECKDFDFQEFNSPVGRMLTCYFNQNLNISNYRFCVIDEEFFTWLDAKSIISDNMIIDYVSKMSDKKAEELWNKYNLSQSTEVLAIPFVIYDEDIPNNTKNKLSKEETNIIRNLIASNTGLQENDIFIPGYLNSFEEITKYEEHLTSIADNYFKEKTNIIFGAMEEQEFSKEFNIFLHAIPVILKENINYKITKDDVAKMISDDLLERDIESEPIMNILKKYYSNSNILTNSLILVDEFEEISKEFEKMINNKR